MSDNFKESVDAFTKTFTEEGFSPAQTPEEFSGELSSEAVPSDELLESSESIDESGEAGKRRQRRNKISYNKRINQLTARLGDSEQNTFFLAQQLAEKEAIIAQQNAALQEKESSLYREKENRNAYYESDLDTQERSIKNELKRAKEEGNIDAEVELSSQLADVKGKKNAFELWKSEESRKNQEKLLNEEYIPYEQTITQPFIQPRYEEPVNEDFAEWVETNQWYANNQSLKEEADIIANEMAKHMSFNGMDNLVGTYAFFDSVANVMRDRYSTSDQIEQPQRQRTMQNHVSPVTRSGTSMADQYIARNPGRGNVKQVSLSVDEYKIARNLQIPTGGGRYLSGDDAIRYYEKAKNYPASPHEGGSPYRLTII